MLKIITIQEASGSPLCRNLRYPDGRVSMLELCVVFRMAVLKKDPRPLLAPQFWDFA